MSENKKGRAALVADPEVVAIHKIVKLLNDLGPDARWRVLVFLRSKYETVPVDRGGGGAMLPFNEKETCE